MSETPPTLSYRAPVVVEEEAESRPPPPLTAVNRVFSVITWAVLGIVLALWLVVGAVFWIPLLLRAVIRFSFSLLHAVLLGHQPTAAARVLRDSVSFYKRGFVAAVEAVTKEELDGETDGPGMGKRLLAELLWAMPVWYLILFGAGWLDVSPVDMWVWITSIEWSQVLGTVTAWFRG
jgi:hypothetical protein